jgi:hypothetical protein
MEKENFILELEKSGLKLLAILDGISDEEEKWKPEPEKWSILEVVNHLVDEEKDDFRLRLEMTLNQYDKSWPPIDPEKWVTDRLYNNRDFGQSLQIFKDERAQSLQWLKNLTNPDWYKQYHHPSIGDIAAGDLMTAWVAHDYLHLKQLANLQAIYLNVLAKPFSIRYASP